MAFMNDFRPEDYNNVTYFDVEDGIHDLKVMGVTVKTSNNGKQMIEVTYAVRECMAVPYIERYCEGEYFNRMMSRFFDAFGIRQGDFNFNNWAGKKGKAMFEHRMESYYGNDGSQKNVNRCRIKYLEVPPKGNNAQAPQQNTAPVQQYQPQQQAQFTEDILF